ncbi:hypothetical protein L6452_43713 [Arctium lappa]|uniref:Uncharacterized protein n=1 Tax=Arctium lappa TaxID=4217 RepID=A0ACB8XHN8_ARCLA|nr:hypothetical protein L6452_43713 [Arctium lappa]
MEDDVSLSRPSDSQGTSTAESSPVTVTPPPNDHGTSSSSDESPISESPDATTSTSTSVTSVLVHHLLHMSSQQMIQVTTTQMIRHRMTLPAFPSTLANTH